MDPSIDSTGPPPERAEDILRQCYGNDIVDRHMESPLVYGPTYVTAIARLHYGVKLTPHERNAVRYGSQSYWESTPEEVSLDNQNPELSSDPDDEVRGPSKPKHKRTRNKGKGRSTAAQSPPPSPPPQDQGNGKAKGKGKNKGKGVKHKERAKLQVAKKAEKKARNSMTDAQMKAKMEMQERFCEEAAIRKQKRMEDAGPNRKETACEIKRRDLEKRVRELEKDAGPSQTAYYMQVKDAIADKQKERKILQRMVDVENEDVYCGVICEVKVKPFTPKKPNNISLLVKIGVYEQADLSSVHSKWLTLNNYQLDHELYPMA